MCGYKPIHPLVCAVINTHSFLIALLYHNPIGEKAILQQSNVQ